MDALSLDRLLDEIRPLLLGRHLRRPRAFGENGLDFEISGREHLRLVLHVAAEGAGMYVLERQQLSGLVIASAPAKATRHGLLHVRKHLDGARVTSLRRAAGQRTLELAAGAAVLTFRLGGRSPALLLAKGGEPLAALGGAAFAGGRDEARPEIASLEARHYEEAEALAAARAWPLARALAHICPSLGPELARALAAAGSLAPLREWLARPEPTLHLPAPLERCSDRALSQAGALAIAPGSLLHRAGERRSFSSWREAAAVYLSLRVRGSAFSARLRSLTLAVRRECERLSALDAHLARDLERLDDPEQLRRRAVALLAALAAVPPGAREFVAADPYDAGGTLAIALDPSLGAAANAERLFEKARRASRARLLIQTRREQVRRALGAAEAETRRLEAAQTLADLEAPSGAWQGRARAGPTPERGARRYFTTRGLLLLVGRNARENQKLTFGVAGPEDVWLHAREMAGAHVILRDREGRASRQDFVEAAEVAAYFSEGARERAVDVHVTRRKHLRSAGGGPGRVRVAHSETLRVTPRDPEGRLRRAR
jgi:hypothetical protein